jgi:hypothetical protein
MPRSKWLEGNRWSDAELARRREIFEAHWIKYSQNRNYREGETYEPPRIAAPDIVGEYETPIWMMSWHGGG